MEDKTTERDKSDVLKQIEEFESLIKNKRLQESGSGDTTIKDDLSKATGSGSQGKINTNNEGVLRREILEDFAEHNSNEDGVKETMPVFDGIGEHPSSAHNSYVENNNTLENAKKQAGSEKPGLTLKDIDSLVFSPIGQDIIIPSTSSDPAMDITDS